MKRRHVVLKLVVTAAVVLSSLWLIVTSAVAAPPDNIGVYDNGIWYLDLNGNYIWDGEPTDGIYYFGGGVLNAVPVTGDWTGSGTTKIGIYEDGTWYFDLNGNGAWDGPPTDGIYYYGGGVLNAVPVAGDWTGSGTTKIGIYEDGTWYLDLNGNGAWDGPPTDGIYYFGGGVLDVVPVTGDWTGSGTTKIGVSVNGNWYLDLNGNGAWEGMPTDALYHFKCCPPFQLCYPICLTGFPVTGDWLIGDGKTKIGVYGNGNWYISNGDGRWDGSAPFGVGLAGARPATGKW